MSDSRKIAQLWHKLMSSASEVQKAGYSVNEFGGFDCMETREQLEELYTKLIHDENDSRELDALRFSLAGLYKRSLMLDKAERILASTTDFNVLGKAVQQKNLMARIYAIQGRDSELEAVLSELNQASTSPMWRLSDDALEQERTKRRLLSLRSL